METLYAYLAGVIDMEGYIFIARRIRYPHRNDGRETAYYVPTIGISDTSRIIPDLLQSTFPARRRQFHPKNAKHTSFHWWDAEFQKAREPLVCLLPHLRLKRR